MKKQKLTDMTTFEDLLEKQLQNPSFKKLWEESEPQRRLTMQLIKTRLEKKMSQKELAEKAGTTQAVVSRIENMNANPSLKFMQKLANALDKKLVIEFR